MCEKSTSIPAGISFDISDKLINALRSRFCRYVNSFAQTDADVRKNILLKKDHSSRVVEEILSLGRQLGLGASNMRLAELTALFHDVGRFQQYAAWKTFADSCSVDHALLGVRILRSENLLDGIDSHLKELIYRVISYHNRASVPEDDTEQCLFFTRLLRDADKLDIWKIVTDYYNRSGGETNRAIELDLPDTRGISTAVYEDVVNQKIVDARCINNLNDFKVLQMGWVFDLNFKPSMQALMCRGYINLIAETMSPSQELTRILEVIKEYTDNFPGDE